MQIKLPPGASYPVPNVVTGFGMDQANLDKLQQLNIIPSAVLAYETPLRFSQGPGTWPLTGTRKLWTDNTAGIGSSVPRTYWGIDRESDGTPRYMPSPKAVDDPILSVLGKVATQQACSLYRQYAAWIPYVPVQAPLPDVTTEGEGRRISFSDIGFSPDIPIGLGEFNYQGQWVLFFAEHVGDVAHPGEVYVMDYQKFVQTNPLDYNAPYVASPVTSAPKSAEQMAAAVAQVTAIVAARAPIAAKFEQIRKAVV